MDIAHSKQKELWEKEHKEPLVLLQMDSQRASLGVQKFLSWLKDNGYPNSFAGLEMGCGKGRNSIGLAREGMKMCAFDFSENAILEARKRAKEIGIEKNVKFFVQDATERWNFENNSFDFAIDCFASTDIESAEGRIFAINEFKRVLKPGGLLLIYTLSTDDEFHKEMIAANPTTQKNGFIHPTTGKFEKVFDRDELLDLYGDFYWLEEQRVDTEPEFFGKKYKSKHFWIVLRKK